MVFNPHDGLFIGQVIIIILLTALILMSVRNYRIAKLLIRDKTIMFVEIETEDDYKKIMANKEKRFKLTDADLVERKEGRENPEDTLGY